MDEQISDYKLLAYYKSIIRIRKEDRLLLISQLNCCQSSIKLPMYGDTGVYVLANNSESKLFGVQTCKNSWSCPVCSARNMAKHASDIACGLDAMYKWKNKVAFMITFAIPHTARYTCKQTYEILQKTWNRFYHHGNKRNRKDEFSNFCEDLGCTERVRVTEFTHGKNGWHPHYHCLFWVDADKLQDVKKYQQSLHDKWLKIAHQMTKKVLLQDFVPRKLPPWDSEEHLIRWIDNFFGQAMRKCELEDFSAAHISLDKDGNVLRAESSQYICGWGADKEVTGNVRKEASHDGHYTPYQILCKAYEARQNHDIVEENKWSNLYLEYARTTTKKRRLSYSPTLRQVIDKWKQTQEYIITFKKKSIENAERVGIWKTVFWFNAQQWREICFYSKKHDIVNKILELALLQDAKQKIIQFLSQYDIDVSKNKMGNYEDIISQIFNVA